MFKLLKGDCMELLETLEPGSVDFILTDPPYGQISSLGKSAKSAEYKPAHWDVALNTDEVFRLCERALRINGGLALFSNGRLTAELISKEKANLPFSYKLIWLKNCTGNALSAKKAPMSYTEDINFFFKPYNTSGGHPLMDYFQAENEKAKALGIRWRQVLKNFMATHYFTTKSQFSIPTAQDYEKLQATGLFQMPFDEILKIHREHLETMNQSHQKVFNLWGGAKSKKNILEYPKEVISQHPTQKPVALLEDLLKTYTNKGATVLDFTMGSGSTGVACMNTGRRFIGFELDDGYFETATKRITHAHENRKESNDDDRHREIKPILKRMERRKTKTRAVQLDLWAFSERCKN